MPRASRAVAGAGDGRCARFNYCARLRVVLQMLRGVANALGSVTASRPLSVLSRPVPPRPTTAPICSSHPGPLPRIRCYVLTADQRARPAPPRPRSVRAVRRTGVLPLAAQGK